MKYEDNYNKFYQNIYELNQDDCFEYKISNELILNVLNFKRNKEHNFLNEKNLFYDINNKQIESIKIKNINNQNDKIQSFQNNRNIQFGAPNSNINSNLYKINQFYSEQNKKNEYTNIQYINDYQLNNFQNEKFNRNDSLT